MYKNCFRHSEQFLYKTISPHVLQKNRASDQDLPVFETDFSKTYKQLTIDDSENVEARNDASILGGLSLGIIEISGDCDNGIFDGFAQVLLSGFLHFGQDLKVKKILKLILS